MAKSLLSSFANDFNRSIGIYPKVDIINDIGEITSTRPTASQSGIKCLLLLRADQGSMQFKRYIRNQVEYIKTTHKLRMDFGPTITVGDKIQDNMGVWYDVQLVISTPGFDGNDDHLLVLCDIVV